MRGGECPKCGSHDVYGSKDGPGIGYGDAVQWEVRTARRNEVSLECQTVLCAGCGYFEQYLLDERIRSDIAAAGGGSNWVRMG